MSAFPCDHDLHIHTRLSGCCGDKAMLPERILAESLARGLKTICVTDHCWSANAGAPPLWYERNDIPHAQSSLPLPQADGARFLFGCETEYLGGDRLGLARDDFDLFDLAVIPVNHFHSADVRGAAPCDTPEAFAELLVSRLEALLTLDLPWRKIGIAHLSFCYANFSDERGERYYPALPEERLKRCFDRLAILGAGIELNGSNFPTGAYADTYLRPFALAKNAGCLFYCGSDAHAVTELSRIVRAQTVAGILGLTANDAWHAN